MVIWIQTYSRGQTNCGDDVKVNINIEHVENCENCKYRNAHSIKIIWSLHWLPFKLDVFTYQLYLLAIEGQQV